MSQTNSSAIPDICPACQTLNDHNNKFCTNCGKPLKDTSLSTTISKQVIIYLVSFFLAPLGLWWGIKYARSPDLKARRIGWISIILTVLSIILSIFIVGAMANSVNSQLNTNLDLDQYRELGL